jgi:16S rRNA processing protein RimM
VPGPDVIAMALVCVGRIGRPHGLDGEVGLDRTSLTAEELLAVRDFLWKSRKNERPVTLTAVRPANHRLLVTFAGFPSRDAVTDLVLGELWVEADRLPDPGPGVAYAFQLVGMEVRDESGRILGTLADVIRTGANDVYVLEGERELLLPATHEVVKHVDMTARVITVSVPAGLEEI